MLAVSKQFSGKLLFKRDLSPASLKGKNYLINLIKINDRFKSKLFHESGITCCLVDLDS